MALSENDWKYPVSPFHPPADQNLLLKIGPFFGGGKKPHVQTDPSVNQQFFLTNIPQNQHSCKFHQYFERMGTGNAGNAGNADPVGPVVSLVVVFFGGIMISTYFFVGFLSTSILSRSSKDYPLVNIQKNYGKSPFWMGKSTINGNVQ